MDLYQNINKLTDKFSNKYSFANILNLETLADTLVMRTQKKLVLSDITNIIEGRQEQNKIRYLFIALFASLLAVLHRDASFIISLTRQLLFTVSYLVYERQVKQQLPPHLACIFIAIITVILENILQFVTLLVVSFIIFFAKRLFILLLDNKSVLLPVERLQIMIAQAEQFLNQCYVTYVKFINSIFMQKMCQFFKASCIWLYKVFVKLCGYLAVILRQLFILLLKLIKLLIIISLYICKLLFIIILNTKRMYMILHRAFLASFYSFVFKQLKKLRAVLSIYFQKLYKLLKSQAQKLKLKLDQKLEQKFANTSDADQIIETKKFIENLKKTHKLTSASFEQVQMYKHSSEINQIHNDQIPNQIKPFDDFLNEPVQQNEESVLFLTLILELEEKLNLTEVLLREQRKTETELQKLMTNTTSQFRDQIEIRDLIYKQGLEIERLLKELE
ncbi:Hypothetical_protein [Hexamita inflata]|uniref:Hypothetical_protein n=1 Tax=Hexamita inflata TaxID=28002 RepID=A0AA86NME8_9EUKA|nr:Hypothetical protein HINF_LOCUS9879 [Hexamita inflata]